MTRVGTGTLTAAGCGTAIAAVCTIGLYQIERLVGGIWSVAAVVIAAIICGLLAQSLARLSSVVPSGAGLLAYLSRGLGRVRGLAITGPYLALCLLLVGAEAVIVGVLIAHVVPVPPIVGALLFVFATWVMCRAGVRVGYRTQAWATWLLIGCLSSFALIALVASAQRGDLAARLLPAAPSALHFVSAIGQALFLFMGFELVTCHAEVSSPRAMRRALTLSVVVLGAFYALISLGYSSLLHAPVGQSAMFTPQLSIAEQAGSRWALGVVIALSLVASFTSVNGAMLALSRFVYALATQRLLPRGFGELHPRSLVARNALSLLLVLSLGATVLVAAGHILGAAIFAAAICASVVYAAVCWVRERPPFREAARAGWLTWRTRLLAAAFIALGVAVLLDAGPARGQTMVLLAATVSLVTLVNWRRDA